MLVLNHLKNLLKLQNRNSGLLFSNDGINPITYRSIQFHYNNAFKAINIKWRSTHIVRHSFATNFLNSGSDHATLSKLLGHSSIKQTEHYAKISGDSIRTNYENFYKNMDNKILLFKNKLVGAGKEEIS